MTITINPIAVVNAGADISLCIGETATLSGTIGGSAGSGTWTGGSGSFSPDAATPNAVYTPTPAEAAAGTVTLTFTTNDPVGPCPAVSDAVVITVIPMPTVNAGPSQTVCSGTTITLAGTVGTGATSGTWSGGTGTYSPSNTALNAVYTPSAAEYAAGSVTLTLTTNDPAGPCPAVTSTVTHSFYSRPEVFFTVDDANGCPAHCVTFADISTVTGATITSWLWSFGDGGTAAVAAPTHCYAASGFYDVTLTVTSSQGCSTTATQNDMIHVFDLPVADFTHFPIPATVLEPTVNFTDQSSADAISWTWYFGDGDSLSGTENPQHDFPGAEPGTYDVWLVVENANGCIDSVMHQIVVGPEFTFFIPNAFTPNNDGINDTFFGTGIGIAEYEMLVFDRWGNLVYLADDLGDKWTGQMSGAGTLVQEDVYVWKVKLKDVFGKKHTYIGTVTVVR
jgi:gliding motility-associated-like protein